MPNTSLREELLAIAHSREVKPKGWQSVYVDESEKWNLYVFDIDKLEALLTAKTTEAIQGASEKPTPQEAVGGKQVDKPIAKKYPMKGELKGSYYGSPKVSSILASFESNLLELHRLRPNYKPYSRAWYKHQDHVRLEAAQAIMDYKADTKVNDLATYGPNAAVQATQIRNNKLQQLSKEGK